MNPLAEESAPQPGEDRRLILLLGRARHQVFTALDRALQERAGVSTAQAGALFQIRERGGCLLGDLSRGLGLDNSAITGLVDRLEKNGFALRKPERGDRRALRVVLTRAGRRAVEKALPVVRDFNEEVRACGSREDARAFGRVLEAIVRKFPG